MRHKLAAYAGALALAVGLAGCATDGGVGPQATGAVGPDRVIYHVNDTPAQAVNALRNINNHLEVNPKAKIIVVTHAQGVDFLFDDAKDRNGNPYHIAIEELRGRGRLRRSEAWQAGRSARHQCIASK